MSQLCCSQNRMSGYSAKVRPVYPNSHFTLKGPFKQEIPPFFPQTTKRSPLLNQSTEQSLERMFISNIRSEHVEHMFRVFGGFRAFSSPPLKARRHGCRRSASPPRAPLRGTARLRAPARAPARRRLRPHRRLPGAPAAHLRQRLRQSAGRYVP